MAPVYERVADRVADGDVPYRDFFLEYPPAAVPAVLIPALAPLSYDRAFVIVAAVALAAAAAVGTTIAPATGVALRGALFVIALGPISVTRYDALVALAVATAIAALAHRRVAVGGAALAVAAAAKLYAVLLLPVVVLFLRDRRRELRRAAVAFVVTGALLCAPFVLVGAGGVRASLDYQLQRPLQLESLGGSLFLLADVLGAAEPDVRFEAGAQAVVGAAARGVSLAQGAVLAVVVLLVVLAFARGRRSSDALIDASAAILAVLVALGSVLSPQYLIWLFPLVVLVTSRRVFTVLLAGAASTQVLYPNRYEELVGVSSPEVVLLVVRNLSLLLVAAALALPWLRAESRPGGGRA